MSQLETPPGPEKPFCVLEEKLLSAKDELLFRDEGQIVVIIVPNRALPTLEMRPFRLAKCRKIRDVNVHFFAGVLSEGVLL